MLNYFVRQALSRHYGMSPYFCLISSSDSVKPPRYGHYYYDFPNPKSPVCHPLETVVLGERIWNPINIQISRIIGMPLQWIDGFVDGYEYYAQRTVVKMNSTYEKLPFYDCFLKNYNDGFTYAGVIYTLIKEVSKTAIGPATAIVATQRIIEQEKSKLRKMSPRKMSPQNKGIP